MPINDPNKYVKMGILAVTPVGTVLTSVFLFLLRSFFFFFQEVVRKLVLNGVAKAREIGEAVTLWVVDPKLFVF